jgi:hypothetical protein
MCDVFRGSWLSQYGLCCIPRQTLAVTPGCTVGQGLQSIHGVPEADVGYQEWLRRNYVTAIVVQLVAAAALQVTQNAEPVPHRHAQIVTLASILKAHTRMNIACAMARLSKTVGIHFCCWMC